MNLFDALVLVEAGEKVRLPLWTPNSHVALVVAAVVTDNTGVRDVVDAAETKPQERYFQDGLGAGIVYSSYLSEELANDWEVLP